MILKIILWMIVNPLLIGMLYTYFLCEKGKKNSLILAFISGYIIEFALFEVITVPITFLKVGFSTLLMIWNILIILLSVVSLILNCKRCKEIIQYNLEEIKKIPIFLAVLVMILIGLQLFVVFRYMHIDDDDATYIGTATTAIYTNRINMHNPARGNAWPKWQARYVLSPFSIYIAVLSQEIGLAPTTIAHTIFPMILLTLMYMIYTLIANKLLNEDKKSVCLFLLLLNIIYIFGNYSIRTNFTFALFRIWQGKAVIANIILPSIWYWYWLSSQKGQSLEMIMMLIIMTAACLPSSMGVILAPLTLITLAFVSTIKNKDTKYLWKYTLTCVPCIACGMIYLILKF